jgi:single-strand DNA-binding protein
MSRTKSAATPAPEASAPAPAPAPEATDDSRTTLVGRLCADPVLRHTKSGFPVTTLRLAVQGTEPTEFIDAVVWRRQAEVVAQYMRKGRLVEVSGTTHSKEWTAKDGTVRQSDEIVASRVQFISSQRPAQGAETELA